MGPAWMYRLNIDGVCFLGVRWGLGWLPVWDWSVDSCVGVRRFTNRPFEWLELQIGTDTQ